MVDLTYPDPFEKLVATLGQLPGVGPKSAQRIAFYLLTRSVSDVQDLAGQLVTARQDLHYCQRCSFLAWGQDLCKICTDPKRDATQLMVVAEPRDVMAIEKSHSYRGYYHVLGGVLSPLHNIGPEDLRLPELLLRLQPPHAIKELIFALAQSVEAEATRYYVLQLLDLSQISVTQLATGLPVGGDLDYIDALTLGQALKQRVSLSR